MAGRIPLHTTWVISQANLRLSVLLFPFPTAHHCLYVPVGMVPSTFNLQRSYMDSATGCPLNYLGYSYQTFYPVEFWTDCPSFHLVGIFLVGSFGGPSFFQVWSHVCPAKPAAPWLPAIPHALWCYLSDKILPNDYPSAPQHTHINSWPFCRCCSSESQGTLPHIKSLDPSLVSSAWSLIEDYMFNTYDISEFFHAIRGSLGIKLIDTHASVVSLDAPSSCF